MKAIAGYYLENARQIVGPSPEIVLDGALCCLAARNILEEEEADAFTMDCGAAAVGLTMPHSAAPCLAFTRMMDGRKGPGGRLNHGGRWEASETWPPEGARDTSFYLNATGVLSTEAPSATASSTTYTHDPKDPVPSAGNPWAFSSGHLPRGPRDQIEAPVIPGQGMPGLPISSRPDVLWYQTAPLEEDVTISVQVRMVLWVSSTAPDTDFCVKLLDIHPPSADYPTGYSVPISDGTLRARYRECFSSPRLMEPGEVYKLEIELEPVANRFLAGHRIGVYVCSSNFPVVEINRNTGDPTDRRSIKADNTVHHDAARPSHIVLPVWRRGKE